LKPVGYLLNMKEGLEGEPGLFYNYILARNGLFVRGESPLLEATVCITAADIRGLSPVTEEAILKRGLIPRCLYDLTLSLLMAERYHERYLAVTWEGEYRLRAPPQSADAGSVRYEAVSSTVLDIHSHGSMRPFFSLIDNQDEQGLKLYMVVGKLDTLFPEVEMRVGVYGYFAPVQIGEVFNSV
jgi:PRTRC genetic system protein A